MRRVFNLLILLVQDRTAGGLTAGDGPPRRYRARPAVIDEVEVGLGGVQTLGSDDSNCAQSTSEENISFVDDDVVYTTSAEEVWMLLALRSWFLIPKYFDSHFEIS